ncbi:sporulation protein [Metabacillus idriensis]|uniref:sporulation protein n=1 Tax=Metabacillus idriensis TaxID=324768 RepID=UPI00174A3F9E|nr:sporulation protein [Metabacillus idriensis]
MDKSLSYLREVLSNYLEDHEVSRHLYQKLSQQAFDDEKHFVRDLSEKELSFLNKMLPYEINHAMGEQDYVRVDQLNEVYEELL